MPKKNYSVSFEYVETDGSVRKEPMTVPLSPASYAVTTPDGQVELHGPWVVEGKPYVGELDDEEIQLLAMLPGKNYSPHWRFTVKAK